jgi:hypothetical protein
LHKRDLSADLRGALTPRKARHQAAVKLKELPALLRAIDGYETIGNRQTRLALQLLALPCLNHAPFGALAICTHHSAPQQSVCLDGTV